MKHYRRVNSRKSTALEKLQIQPVLGRIGTPKHVCLKIAEAPLQSSSAAERRELQAITAGEAALLFIS